jgi:SAM-dependent methyltransferase
MSKLPKDLAFKIYSDYYQKGSYGLNRYIWTITTFSKIALIKGILEIGCGDGQFTFIASILESKVMYMEWIYLRVAYKM